MAAVSSKMTLYSFAGSQWAGVPHLTLAEKGFNKSEYNVKEIDLVLGENFDPEYMAVNSNGTIPSLTAPLLSGPLIESNDILEYLNSVRKSGPQLLPEEPAMKQRVQQLIELVHSPQVGTNLILLQARDKAEMDAKKASPWKSFVVNRQVKLEKDKVQFPDSPFYGPKAEENGALYHLYTTEVGPAHEEFFALTEKMFVDFAAGVEKLDSLLVLPYAAGEELTAADLHIVPWLSHALWGAGATGPQDFAALETLISKSVPGFKFGQNIKAWWLRFSERDSFKEVYSELH